MRRHLLPTGLLALVVTGLAILPLITGNTPAATSANVSSADIHQLSTATPGPALPSAPDPRALLVDVPGIASVSVTPNDIPDGVIPPGVTVTSPSTVLITPTPGLTDAQLDDVVTSTKARLGSVGNSAAVDYWSPMIELAPGFTAAFTPTAATPVAEEEQLAWVRWLRADGRASAATSNGAYLEVRTTLAQAGALAVDLDKFTRATFDLSRLEIDPWTVMATDGPTWISWSEETKSAALANFATALAIRPGTQGSFDGSSGRARLIPAATGAGEALTPALVAAGATSLDESLYSQVNVQLGLWYGAPSTYRQFTTPTAQAIAAALAKVPGIQRITVDPSGVGLDVQLGSARAWRGAVHAMQRLVASKTIAERPIVSLLWPSTMRDDYLDSFVVRARPEDDAATLATYSKLLRIPCVTQAILSGFNKSAAGVRGLIGVTPQCGVKNLTAVFSVLRKRTPQSLYELVLGRGNQVMPDGRLGPQGVDLPNPYAKPLPPGLARRLQRAWEAARP